MPQTTFEYVIAKFTPDFVKDEPRNIGVIVHEKSSLESYGIFIDDFNEIKNRDPKVNVDALQKIIKGYRGKHKIDSEDYLYRLVKHCVHSLYFKNVCGKKAISPELAAQELFDEYISIKPKQVAA